MDKQEFIQATERNHPGLTKKLGKVKDNLLANEYGLSRERIRQIREELDIPRCDVHSAEYLEVNYPEAWKLAGTKQDKILATELNISILIVKKIRRVRNIPICHRGIVDPHSVQGLGVVPDYKLAKKLKVHPNTVLRAREYFGIPSTYSILKNTLGRVEVTHKDLIENLWTDTAKNLALKYKTTEDVVARLRRKYAGTKPIEFEHRRTS